MSYTISTEATKLETVPIPLSGAGFAPSTELNSENAHREGITALGALSELPGNDNDDAKDLAAKLVTLAVGDFKTAIAGSTLARPASLSASIEVTEVDPENYEQNGWYPGRVFEYTSEDPFNKTPQRKITSDFIQRVMDVTAALGSSQDPELTYVEDDLRKRNRTPVTKAIMTASPAMSEWIDNLPSAEELDAVARPYVGATRYTLDEDKNVVEATPIDAELATLTAGAIDGWGVREREAWQRAMYREFFNEHPGMKHLVATSLGTGTGRATIDAFLDAREQHGINQLTIHGLDLDPSSLEIAKKMASIVSSGLIAAGAQFEFKGRQTDLLNKEALTEALCLDPKSLLFEAIGFNEYVLDDKSADPKEQRAYKLAARRGWIPIVDFLQTVYEGMPEGAQFLTGNMDRKSPQLEFVEQGLGWGMIMARGLEEYLDIWRRTEIDREALSIFVPKQGESSGVYNLARLKKTT